MATAINCCSQAVEERTNYHIVQRLLKIRMMMAATQSVVSILVQVGRRLALTAGQGFIDN